MCPVTGLKDVYGDVRVFWRGGDGKLKENESKVIQEGGECVLDATGMGRFLAPG